MDFCEHCDKPMEKCKCDVHEDEAGTMFNPTEPEPKGDGGFSSM